MVHKGIAMSAARKVPSDISTTRNRHRIGTAGTALTVVPGCSTEEKKQPAKKSGRIVFRTGADRRSADEKPVSYRQWFRDHVLPSRGMTVFTAFYVHWLLLLILSGVFLPMPDLFQPFSFSATFTSDDDFVDELTAPLDSRIELVDEQPVMFEIEQPIAVESISAATVVTTTPDPDLEVLPDAFKSLAIRPNGENDGESSPQKMMPAVQPAGVPKNAVTAGSFTVWTEPENPDPGEPYSIFVQVRVPEGTDEYSVADLEGVVVGSDGYQKKIPGTRKGFLPIVDNKVTLELPIVSADALVEDVVIVRSKMLREAHRLRITF